MTQSIASRSSREVFENVKRFDPDVIADQYLQLYREVAGANS